MEHGRVIGSGATEDVLEQYRLILNPIGEKVPSVASTADRVAVHVSKANQAPDTSGTVIVEDSARWAGKTASLLREKRFNEVNLNRLIRELEQIASNPPPSLKRDACTSSSESHIIELVSELAKNLLLWHFLIEKRTVLNQKIINHTRAEILSAIEANPSLHQMISQTLDRAYPFALDAATHDAGIDSTGLPRTCPVDLQTLLNKEWFPGQPTDSSSLSAQQ